MAFKWSVVMCCYNSRNRIEPALKSLFSQSFLADNVIELVIVDNNSTDKLVGYIDSLSIPENISLRYVFESKPGLSNARKCGAMAASGEFICWVDDDNDLAVDYIQVATGIFDRFDDAVFLGGKALWPEAYISEGIPNFVGRFSKAVAVGEQRKFSCGFIERGDFLWGAGLCVRREMLTNLYSSQFEPILTGRVGRTLMSGEDGELAILLQLMGDRGYYTNMLLLTHRVQKSRFTINYFCRLFYGFGFCLPVLRRYRELLLEIDNENGPSVRKLEETSTTKSKRYSVMYGVFGILFLFGFFRGYFSAMQKKCEKNVTAIFDELNKV